MKTIRIALLILIIAGLGLIFTQKFWVARVVNYIILNSPDKYTEVSYVVPEPQDEKENPPKTDAKSGVTGIVTTSPTCPVERIPQEPGCEPRPYSTSINIIKEGDTKIIKTIESDARGEFSVDLVPGSYILRAENEGIFPRCNELTVEVKSGKYTKTEMSCDTGIR
ncbi:MAG: hypothetical protein WAV15_00225 [Minisyncoccia bacterium]